MSTGYTFEPTVCICLRPTRPGPGRRGRWDSPLVRDDSLSRPAEQSPVGLWIIGIYKLAKASLLIAAGAAIIRFRHSDVAAGLQQLAARLRLDPDNRFLNTALARLSGIDARHLEMIGAGTCLYGLLYVAQGVGLLLQRRWGEYLVIITTGFLIPFEAYEVTRKLSFTRVAIVAVNVGIVAYLAARLRRERRAGAGPEDGTRASA